VIAIVNYGSGNIQAIANIYHRLGVPFRLASRPEDLLAADRILLPGVGAFDQVMTQLQDAGIRPALDEAVLERRTPVLGICVGMQLMARTSEEGTLPGLGWIDADVKRFDHASFEQVTHLPHMGWNTVTPRRASPLFADVVLETGYYFLHSYYCACADPADELATAHYGIAFAAVVQRDHVFGVQFHPEKSHEAGIRLLSNFATLPLSLTAHTNPAC
jgi:imidazole glycerol-phosphate synthase subunit HisH